MAGRDLTRPSLKTGVRSRAFVESRLLVRGAVCSPHIRNGQRLGAPTIASRVD
jgi:hypothetical protein